MGNTELYYSIITIEERKYKVVTGSEKNYNISLLTDDDLINETN